MIRPAILAITVTLAGCTTYQGYPALIPLPNSGGAGAVGPGNGVNIWSGTVNGQGFTVVTPAR